MNGNITELFCEIDDFCILFSFLWAGQANMLSFKLAQKPIGGYRKPRLSESEIMTILIAFHQSDYRTFKGFYLAQVQKHWRPLFPGLVSYSRFVALIKRVLVPMCYFLKAKMGICTGLSFVDSTAIKVCHNRRIHNHKVFKELAERGKTSVGWFYGFKLHLIVNDCGELLAFHLTQGNMDDRAVIPDLSKHLSGKLYGDKGYISMKLVEQLFKKGIDLVTKVRKNMKKKLRSDFDNLMLRKRAIIESVNDQLKNISQIEHTRHRSVDNFMVNMIGGLIAYCLKPKKPSLGVKYESKVPQTIVL